VNDGVGVALGVGATVRVAVQSDPTLQAIVRKSAGAGH